MKKVLVLSSIALACTTLSVGAYAQEYARVISATPINQQVAYPHQVCSTSEQRVYQSNPNGAVAGAILGGVLGNVVGANHHRTGSTVAGAVVGGVIGNEVTPGYTTTVPVQNCYTENTYTNNVVGYNVVYFWHGGRYRVRTAVYPGQYVAVDPYAVRIDPPPVIIEEPIYEPTPIIIERDGWRHEHWEHEHWEHEHH